MSINSEFFALLDGPVFGGKLYRGIALEAAAPYGVFSRVAAIEGVTLDDNGGADNEFTTRMQLDIYDASGTGADSLAAQAKAALKAWSRSNIILLEQDDYEPDTKLYRVMLQIEIIA